MFNKKVIEKPIDSHAHTLVSRSTEIVGDIHFSGELIIEGKVKGSIYAEDDSKALIRVAEGGCVDGEICVPTAIVNGLVQGDVRCANHIELASKAVVVGNVYYNLIEMVMGSEVNGNLMHLSSQLSDAQKLGLDRQGLNKQALSFETSSFDSSSVDNK
ncbi:MAG: polymer-forming cytoskeletal protein [Gammaproteobacteria bacterium]|nr:polymer-forming cytoskeletal protein [Gammaproteobacteria bacterium]MBT3861147.1 polymer-forming cytoskeletal protein [Gammaproteobacteria bacterium]MBT3988022.1 polymer-forming cytoskeletal protein [Gammaproteobacteria bacterium]MBT4254646.1 polymer-forming cytoskeletal protein [Gammaproteobacteria bacterium]MBT4580816.1 polymer-forming cytoskeletal protein [Gammaproteobacteria bacterium]